MILMRKYRKCWRNSNYDDERKICRNKLEDELCFVQTCGAMCVSCGVECCDYALTWDDWEAITKYMQKNKLAQTPETYDKVIKFVCNKRENKLMK